MSKTLLVILVVIAALVAVSNAQREVPAITGCGQVTEAVTMAFAVAGDVAFARLSTGAITLGFKTATAVPTGGKIVITVPYMYFSAADVTKVNTFASPATTTATCTYAAGTVAAGSTLTCETAVASLTAGAQTMTLIIAAVTTGSTQAAGVFKVHTTTAAGVTIDTQLATGGVAPAIIGGQLLPRSNMAFTTAANLNCHTLSTGTVTLGFNTSTAVPLGGKIVITVPYLYFSAVDVTKANISPLEG